MDSTFGSSWNFPPTQSTQPTLPLTSSSTSSTDQPAHGGISIVPIGSPSSSSSSSAAAVNLRQLIASKSNELSVLSSYANQQLHESNSQLQAALEQSQQRYAKLKEDFQYNLQLLAQRDAELNRYDELSITYARTLEQKSDEWKGQIRQVEMKLEEKSLQYADLNEAHNKLRQTCSTLQEQLSTQQWQHETEIRNLKHNSQQALREVEEKLNSKDELASRDRYELFYNFERATETASAESQSKIDKLMSELKSLQHQNEQQVKELERANERLQVEQHKRTTVEEKLNDTNTKLIDAEGQIRALQESINDLKRQHEDEAKELTISHESLVKKCVSDYKLLASQLDKVQSQYLAQSESHSTELDSVRRDHERLVREIHDQFNKQLKEKEADLLLTQQQLRDSQTLAQTLQTELDEYQRAETIRTSQLNDQLGEFQSSHVKQIQELNLAIWKSEEERKSEKEKYDIIRKSLDDRREEVRSLKEQLAATERRCEELDRKSTEVRLKYEKDQTFVDEQVANLKLSLKTAQDATKRAQSERDAAIANHDHAQTMITEYQHQLKSVREELLQLHSQENAVLEHRRLERHPDIQQQFQQVGRELETLGADMKGFQPFIDSTIPTTTNTGAPPSFGLNSPLSQPSSARSYAQHLTKYGNFDALSPKSSSQYSFDTTYSQSHSQQQQHQLRPRRRSTQKPSSSSSLYHNPSSDDQLSGDDSHAASHHQHNLSAISEISDVSVAAHGNNKPSGNDPSQPSSSQRLTNSEPNPQPQPSTSTAALSSSTPNPTPPVKIVTALQLNVVSDDEHQPIDVELPSAAPSRRSSQFKAARKQSITTPNINLNAGQASLESQVPTIREERKVVIEDVGHGHTDSDSGSENDFIEQPLSDSSVDTMGFHRPGSQQKVIPPSQRQQHHQHQQHQHQRQHFNHPPPLQPTQQGRPQAIHSAPVRHESVEDEQMSAELVGNDSIDLQSDHPRRGNVTPPDSERYRPHTAQSDRINSGGSIRPIHSPRPYTPAFSEDFGPVSLPNSMPNSPMGGGSTGTGGGGRPNSGQCRGMNQQQRFQEMTQKQHHLSPPPHHRANANRRQPIPILPIGNPNEFDSHTPYSPSSHRPLPSGGNTTASGYDSHRSSASTTSHTSSHVALEKNHSLLATENATLRDQNNALSEIIKEMKKELENLLLHQQQQQSQQAKLDLQAAGNMPPGTVPGTISIPATQYKALQLQLQTQAHTLASQTKQLEESRTMYEKLQFHHALLLAELESLQQHLPPNIIQQHISAELTFLRTYTRELNSTITNLKTELMYLQAQSQHSATVLDSKHQQAILLHSQSQQLEQLQVALQFKEHKLLELDAQLQARVRETEELKGQLAEANQRLTQWTIQAQQESQVLKQQAIKQLIAQQQQQQQAAATAAGPSPPPSSQSAPPPQPTAPAASSAQPVQQIYPHPAYNHPMQPIYPGMMPMPYPPHGFFGPPYPSNYPAPTPAGAPASEYGYASNESVIAPSSVGPTDDGGMIHLSDRHSHRRSSAPNLHSPPESSRSTDISGATDLSSPPHAIRLRARSTSTSPARRGARSRSNSRSGRFDPSYTDSGDDSSIDLSLAGSSVQPSRSSSRRRELPFHASDRATDSQNASGRAIRIRAELIRKKDAEVKARADAARARVKEQMKRMKAIEVERQRQMLEGLDAATPSASLVPSPDQENNPWTVNEPPRSHRSSIDLGEPPAKSSSSRPSALTASTVAQRERERERQRAITGKR